MLHCYAVVEAAAAVIATMTYFLGDLFAIVE